MKKRFFAALAACALLLSGCAGGQKAGNNTENAENSNSDLRELTVVLDWYPNALHAFLYQAEQAGYFAEEGLTVNIQPPAGVNDAMSMVAAGKADIGLYYPAGRYSGTCRTECAGQVDWCSGAGAA